MNRTIAILLLLATLLAPLVVSAQFVLPPGCTDPSNECTKALQRPYRFSSDGAWSTPADPPLLPAPMNYATFGTFAELLNNRRQQVNNYATAAVGDGSLRTYCGLGPDYPGTPAPNIQHATWGPPMAYSQYGFLPQGTALDYTFSYIDNFNAAPPPPCQEVHNYTITPDAQAPIYCPNGWAGPYSDTNTGPWCYRRKCIWCKISPVIGNPIDVFQKIKLQHEIDYATNGLLRLERDYRSDGFAFSYGSGGVPPTSFGIMWRSSYERRLVEALTSGSARVAQLNRPDGRQLYFTEGTNGYLGSPDSPGTLRRLRDAQNNPIGWLYESTGDELETYDATGILTRIDRRDGRYVTIAHDNDTSRDWVTSVADEHGRTLIFNYDLRDGYPGQARVNSVTLPDGNTVSYDYNDGNLISAVHLPGGITRRYGYDDPNWSLLLTSIVDENGVTYASFTYDANHHPLTTSHAGGVDTYQVDTNQTAAYIDPLGAEHIFTIQAVGYASRITAETKTCSGCTTTTRSIHYDAGGNVDYALDFNGNKTTYSYDSNTFVETSRTEATGKPAQRTTNTVWDASFRVPDQRTVLNSSGTEALTKWAYNSRAQTTARCEIDPDPTLGVTGYVCGSQTNAPTGVRQTMYAYCELSDVNAHTCPLVGLLKTVDGPRTDVPDITTYTYYQTSSVNLCSFCHKIGDLYQITNAMGQTTTYVSYDKNGRVTRIYDANGTYTDMTYHARGWLLTRTVRANADGTPNSTLDATTPFAYDNVGNVTKVTQPDGAYLSYTYDTAHRLTKITDNLSNTIDYCPGGVGSASCLDAAGNRLVEQTKDPSGTLKRSLSRQYDQLNHLTQLLNAGSARVQQYENPAENPPSGITYNDGYDGNGNAVYSTAGPDLRVGSSGTEQQYDPLNRLVKTLQDHAGTGATRDTTTQYAYDTRDNLRSVIDPDNLATNYTYDGLNNLTNLSSPDTGNTGYTYDAAGNRKTQTDARGVISTYSYDALNRLVGISYPTTSLNITYAYDVPATNCYNFGRLTKITDNSGSTTYCYDRRGNIVSKTQVTNGVTLATSYAYTLADRLWTITYPSGAIITYGRDSVGRVTSVTYKANAQATAVTVLSGISYYPFGPQNVFTFGNGRTLTKTYDSDYAIDQIVSSAGAAYGLVVDASVDVLGNLTNASKVVGANPPTQQYQYDPLSRLTNVQNGTGTSLESFTYDLTGDRLSKTLSGTTSPYSYTPSTHHLTSVAGTSRSYDANGNTTTIGSSTGTYDNRNRLTTAGAAAFNYNGRGERVFKTGKLFSYDEGGRLLGEYTTTGALGAEYIYVDSIPVGYVTGGIVYYVETDQLGTPRQVILPGATTANDVTKWKWDYFASNSAFGENAPSVQTITFNLRFPGQYFDVETGLNYNYFRDYEPGTGRYVESDPIGLKGGNSTYAYVQSSPLSRLDFYGLKGCPPGTQPYISESLLNYPQLAALTANDPLCVPIPPKPDKCACPGASWSGGGTGYNLALGGYFSSTTSTLTCESRNVSCKVRTYCFGGGGIIGGGAGGSWETASGGSGPGLGGFSNWGVALQAGAGFVGVGGQIDWGGNNKSGSAGGSFGVDIGAAAIRCYTSVVSCDCPCAQ